MKLQFKFIALSALLITSQQSFAALQDFAKGCDDVIGYSVPEIDCNAGTPVPTTNGSFTSITLAPYGGTSPTPADTATTIYRQSDGTFTQPATCDKPNVLNSECDPGSKFQVVLNNPEAYIVAHCRQKGSAANTYPDIALIQYNKVTGATCFYQSNTHPQSKQTYQNNLVPAPRSGTLNSNTGTTVVSASNVCFNCHSNGPLIRSPYLTQIQWGRNVIPGFGANSINPFNLSQPYDQAVSTNGGPVTNTQRYHVNVSNTACTSCHGMTIHSGSLNTDSIFLAEIATREVQSLSKTPLLSMYSPQWMTGSGPNQTSYDSSAHQAALDYRACGDAYMLGQTLPSGCTVTPAPGKANPPRHLVSRNGKCLDINSANISQVTSVACSAVSTTQKWTYDDVQKQFKTQSNQCLTASSTSPVPATVSLSLSACSNTNNFQKWNYSAYFGSMENVGIKTLISLPQSRCLSLADQSNVANMFQCPTPSPTLNGSQAFALQLMEELYIEQAQYFSIGSSDNLNVSSSNILGYTASTPSYAGSKWTLERVGTSYRIKNKQNNQYLYYNPSASPTLGTAPLNLTTPNIMLWNLRNRPEQGQNVYTLQNNAATTVNGLFFKYRNGLSIYSYNPDTVDRDLYFNISTTF